MKTKTNRPTNLIKSAWPLLLLLTAIVNAQIINIPDIYFKGGDYTPEQIPEAPTVQSYGGTVAVMPVYDGHSTTSSLKKIKPEAA